MDDALIYFSKMLREKLASNLKKVILFGSRARGDFNEGSDYDFLVVLEKKDKQIVRDIRDIEVEILNKFDVLAGSLIYDESEWELRKGLPIGMNILREGKPL